MTHDIDALIAKVDAEMAQARAEMIRRIDEEIIPAMVARRQRNLGLATSREIELMFRGSPRMFGHPSTVLAAREPSEADCRRDLLRMVEEGGPNGAYAKKAREALTGLGYPSRMVDGARDALEREGRIVLGHACWRLAKPEDRLSYDPELMRLAASRPWSGARELVLACFRHAAPQPLRMKAIRLVVEAGGYVRGSAVPALSRLRDDGLVERCGERGMWRLSDSRGR